MQGLPGRQQGFVGDGADYIDAGADVGDESSDPVPVGGVEGADEDEPAQDYVDADDDL